MRMRILGHIYFMLTWFFFFVQPIYEPQQVRQNSQPVRAAPKPSAPQPYRQQVTLGKQSPGGNMSALSSNLSELDSLLQDLSSAQFMAEVDRRNAGMVGKEMLFASLQMLFQ